MRLLVLISSPTATGPAAPVALIAKRMQQAGHTVTVATDSRRSGDIASFVPESQLPPPKLILSTVAGPDQYLSDVRALSGWLKNNPTDAIIAALENDAALALASQHPPGRRVPIFRWWSYLVDMRRPVASRWLARRMSGLLMPSMAQRDYWSRKLKIPDKRCFCPGPLLEPERFAPSTAARRAGRARWGYKQGDRVLGLVGRFKAGRGQIETLQALIKYSGSIPKLKILMVGWGEDWQLAKWLIEKHDLMDRIQLTGFLEDDLSDAYHAMDALLLPAIGRDGYGRAALEALACGAALWAIDRPETRSLLPDEAVGGWLSSPDVSQLGSLLENVATDNHLVSLRNAARGWAKEEIMRPVAAELAAFIESGR